MNASELPKLHVQFDDLEQQEDAATFAMWIFLATEVLFFGALLMAYAVYRATYPDAFAEASKTLNLTFGTVNTALLLTSSFFMAIAVKSSRDGNLRKCVGFLLATLVFGAAFLGIKAMEYHEDFEKGLYAGLHYRIEPSHGIAIFYSLYYSLTGLHAFHMTIGILLIAIFAIKTHFGKSTPTQIEVLGLYWHFVDLVWVFLYPLLYLVGSR